MTGGWRVSRAGGALIIWHGKAVAARIPLAAALALLPGLMAALCRPHHHLEEE